MKLSKMLFFRLAAPFTTTASFGFLDASAKVLFRSVRLPEVLLARTAAPGAPGLLLAKTLFLMLPIAPLKEQVVDQAVPGRLRPRKSRV